MTHPVTYQLDGQIGLIQVNNPPVNALSQAVREGLQNAITQFANDDAAKVAVIHGSGRLFIGGADISEFGKPPQAPALPDVLGVIESTAKPVVAAIHGAALGGGLEVGLAAHYRVAATGTKLGLPEVTLGILPGAGGTQRVPRLVGVQKALDMITTGKPLSAQAALEAKLVDEIAEGSDAEAALKAGKAFAEQLISNNAPVRMTKDQPIGDFDPDIFQEYRQKLEKSARGQVAQLRCVDAVEAATQLDFAAGMNKERALFQELMQTPQREGLIHAFFAERKVAKLPEIEGVQARQVAAIGVIGGGTMGAGIATAALLRGLHVTLTERDTSAADKAEATITKNLAGAVKRGKLTEDKQNTILSEHFTTATDYSALAEADLIIEAVFEDMEVKQAVFAELDKVAKAGAVLATNTSYLDINAIAAVTDRPEDVIGLHFFSPAHIMKLLEVVVADKTSTEVVATSFALAKQLGKIAVRAGVCDGFIGNRILAHYKKAAEHMVLDGASPYQVDQALVDFGFAMGPFAVGDLAGQDIGWATRKRKASTRDPRERVPTFADEICERGWFGQKSGRGFYIYEEGKRGGKEDPEVLAIIDKAREDAGITPREFTDEEIVTRYMAAMINEGARVLDEGIAQRPLDIDMVFLSGYGFPRFRGGPMKYADMQGVENILATIKTLSKEDDFYWQPAPLLEKLVAEKRDFASLNEAQ